MPTGNWETVNAALYQIGLSLQGEGLRIAEVSDWNNPAPQAYPHLMALPQDKGENDYDNQGNLNKMRFTMRIEFPDPKDRETHINMLRTADAFDSELRKKTHWTLGGVVHNFKFSPRSTWGRTGDDKTQLVVYDVDVEAQVLADTTL